MAKDTETQEIGSEDIATIDAGTVMPLSKTRQALRQRLVQDVLGNDDAMERIAEDIMNADTMEAILDIGTLSAEDLLEVPLEFRGYVLRPASEEYPDSEAFAVIDAVCIETVDSANVVRGEVLVITCGGYNVIATLLRAEQLDAFPFRAAFRQAGRALRLYRPDFMKTIEV